MGFVDSFKKGWSFMKAAFAMAREDRKLLAAFDAGRSLQELAGAHERTMGAVRARLLKYGRINA